MIPAGDGARTFGPATNDASDRARPPARAARRGVRPSTRPPPRRGQHPPGQGKTVLAPVEQQRAVGLVGVLVEERLQALGVGVGLAFPGEANGPKRQLNSTDPRGFKCEITDGSYKSAGTYCASIHFPDRDQPEALGDWTYFADGVQRKACWSTDEFVGTADDLISAGLVPPGHFPGCPGMRKTIVTILPNGSIHNVANATKHSDSKNPGAKWITRASKGKFSVDLFIPKELSELRLQTVHKARDEWEKKMDSLPRPPRIDGKPTQRRRSTPSNTQADTVGAWKNQQTWSFDTLRLIVEDHPGLQELNSLYKYDAISRMRILAKMDELERAIQGGVVLHKAPPEQPHNGNVISIHRNACQTTDGSWI